MLDWQISRGSISQDDKPEERSCDCLLQIAAQRKNLGQQSKVLVLWFNSKGNIEIPNIGSVHVENKTIEETKASIQTIVDEYLIGSTVVVKHLNFEITILGEVNQPGTYPIYKQNITILEALGISGDLTDYANRKEIIIVRENSRTFSCDLTSSKLLESEAYYLQPRDVVYIQPTGSVVFRKSKIQLLFSGITSISVMLSVVLKVMGII